jgi:hypothetical protein
MDFTSYDPNIGHGVRRRGGARKVVRPKNLLRSAREMQLKEGIESLDMVNEAEYK